jgi:hypothetical protein
MFVAVVDYDALRAAAANTVEQKVDSVKSFVSKFEKAQRAAESTLDL